MIGSSGSDGVPSSSSDSSPELDSMTSGVKYESESESSDGGSGTKAGPSDDSGWESVAKGGNRAESGG